MQIFENDINVQKQPLEVFYKKKLFLKFCNICRKKPEFSLFLIKLFQHRCFPVNIAKFLRTPILKNIFKQLLLNVAFNSNEEKHLLSKLDEMG